MLRATERGEGSPVGPSRGANVIGVAHGVHHRGLVRQHPGIPAAYAAFLLGDLYAVAEFEIRRAMVLSVRQETLQDFASILISDAGPGRHGDLLNAPGSPGMPRNLQIQALSRSFHAHLLIPSLG